MGDQNDIRIEEVIGASAESIVEIRDVAINGQPWPHPVDALEHFLNRKAQIEGRQLADDVPQHLARLRALCDEPTELASIPPLPL